MRAAADELRAELAGETVTFVVNRNINVSNVCTVGCAFCGFGQGKRSPDAYEHDERGVRPRACARRVDYGATELCIQSGIHPDWTLEDYLGWLRLAKATARRRARSAPARVQPDGDRAHVRHLRAAAARRCSRACATRAWARRRAPPRRCCTTACANASRRTSCRSRAGWRSSRPPTAAGLRSTATVMFGHIEEPWELAEHMRVVRELQERTGGITEFVPLSFIPFQTLLGRTHGVEEISREENLKHTAVFRLALGRTIPSLQASLGEDGARRRDRVAALGRQRPRRHADGGVDQPPRGLLPRHQARPRAARRAPRTRPGARRPSARRCTRSGAATSHRSCSRRREPRHFERRPERLLTAAAIAAGWV